MTHTVPFDGKLYRPCHKHTIKTHAQFIGRTQGFATLICHTCHHIYKMDEHGNEVSDNELIKILLEREANP